MNLLMRLLPHVPSHRIALEPERKVGSAAVSPGFPLARICSQLPAGGDPYLIFKVEGFQRRIEHRRRSQFGDYTV